MQGFRQIGESILRSITSQQSKKQSSNDFLVSCRSQLNQFKKQLLSVEKQFDKYCKNLALCSDISVVLLRIVGNPYNDKRSDWVNKYNMSQDVMADGTVKLCNEMSNSSNGLVILMKQFIDNINEVLLQIDEAEMALSTIHSTNKHYLSLTALYNKKSNSDKINKKELVELEEKIKDCVKRKSSLTDSYENSRLKVEVSVKQLMKSREDKFDEIFTLLLKFQYELHLSHVNELKGQFKSPISVFKEPSTVESNDIKDNKKIPTLTEFESEKSVKSKHKSPKSFKSSKKNKSKQQLDDLQKHIDTNSPKKEKIKENDDLISFWENETIDIKQDNSNNNNNNNNNDNNKNNEDPFEHFEFGPINEPQNENQKPIIDDKISNNKNKQNDSFMDFDDLFGPTNDVSNTVNDVNSQELPKLENDPSLMGPEELDVKVGEITMKHAEQLIKDWGYIKKNNHDEPKKIHSLITGLDNILWDSLKHKWKKVTLPELMTRNKVKKYYQKAVKLVHPDKSSNRYDTKWQKYICRSSFELLNDAYKKYDKSQS